MQLLYDARQHRLTVAEYATAEIEGRTELIGGVVYDVSPRNEPHRFAVSVLVEILVRGLGPQFAVRSQDAIAVSGWSGNDAPEVDVAVIARGYHDPMPTAADAFALIEISDTTYRDDRRVKIPLYANAGVPAGIVNIATRCVEWYASVDDLALEHGRVFGVGESFEILGVDVPVARLFPPTTP